MKSEKLIGFFFFFVGMGIIIFSVVNLFLVFLGRANPWTSFSFETVKIDAGKLISSSIGIPMGGGGEEQSLELIPQKDFNLIVNITAHFFLMGFLSGVGSKIANLGIVMAKEINVSVKEKRA